MNSEEKLSELRIEYVALDTAVGLLWEKNPKLHDLQILVESISRHAFRDAPAFDAQLQNSGAIVDGNGRIEALAWMFDHEYEPPDGIRVDDSGIWYVPIQFGVDSKSQDAAVPMLLMLIPRFCLVGSLTVLTWCGYGMLLMLSYCRGLMNFL